MITYQLILENEHGLHARPAGLIVQTSGQFQSKMTLIKNGTPHNCKSVLGLMKMAGSRGDVLQLEVEGPDEVEAAASVKALFASNFNE